MKRKGVLLILQKTSKGKNLKSRKFIKCLVYVYSSKNLMFSKKIISFVFCLFALLTTVVGCTQADNSASTSQVMEKYELALITDLGPIDDQSFNQASWEGLRRYAEENDIAHKSYQTADESTDAYLASIDLAIENGGKLVICPGNFFEPAIFIAQDQYPDISFILIDGQPRNPQDNVAQIGQNVLSLLYQEEQAGFLAGYGAVKDGHTKLGFIGGMAVPPVIRYGYGFVQGADFAAQELGITADINYTYSDSFLAQPEIQTRANDWYQSGTSVIFSCGGQILDSIIAAAEENDDRKIIGVDVDQSRYSQAVMTSAIKMLTPSVYNAIDDYYSNSFQGGSAKIFSAENNGIGLAMENSQFTSFSQADYDAIYGQLASGQIVIANQIDDSTTADLVLKATVVNYLN